MTAPELANVLPRTSALLLQAAASTPITRADPLARVKAIEEATKRIKARYPQLFKQEP